MPYASFRSINFPDRFIRHSNFLGELTPVVSDLDKRDATFDIIESPLRTELISFRSINITNSEVGFQSFWLRHQNFRLRLDTQVFEVHPPDHPLPPPTMPVPDLENIFYQDSAFIMTPGLADVTAVSFRSLNFPDRYIRHRDLHLFVERIDSPTSRLDATFRIEQPFIPQPPPGILH